MAKAVLAEVKALARHLPVLGGAAGVVVLCTVSIGIAEHAVRELLGSDGDVTALVTRHVEALTAVSVKAAAWGEQVLAFLGVL